MAEKKIFTSLAFQSGAKLVAPKVEIITPETNLTQPASNNNYYTGSAGQLAYNNGNIWVNNDSIWTKLLNHATTATISGDFTFDRVDGNANGVAPFFIGSNSNNKLVAGLNADKLDGYDARNALNDGTTHSIPRRDDNNLFHVGTPTEATHVSNKQYVDNAVQGLDHKESVKYATTANLSSISGTGTISGVDGSVAAGDRILVKNQTTSVDNGIYVATSSGNWNRATDADESGYSNLVDFTSAGTSSGWSATDSDTAVWNSSGKSSGTYYFTPVTPTLVAGKTYKATLTITNYSGTGAFGMSSSGGVGSSLRGTANTTVSVYFVANGDPVKAFGLDTNNGTIDLTIKETDLTEGAFVFVESGDTLANSSWVLSDIVNHPPAQTWAQFSGAGQITAGDGLAKSGDTLSVDLAAGTPLEIASNKLSMAAIGTNDLADDAVTPAKLDDDGVFTMGKLTISAGNAALILDDTSSGSEFAIFSNENELRLAKSNASFPNGYLTLNGTGDVSVGRNLTAQGTFGLGSEFVQQTLSPNGTLHVQTARYSTTNKVTDGSAISDTNWDANAGWSFGSGVATFTTGSGTGRVKQDSVFASADQGKRFKVTFTMSATGLVHIGNSTGNLAYVGNTDSANGTYNTYAAGTHTVWFILPVTGSYDTTSLGFWSHNVSGSFSISNISVYEDTLSASTSHTALGGLSVNDAANDLVIANNDHGGLSIITPADKKGIIFFGDKNDNDRGGIKYDHAETNSVATDERMEFSVNGDNKALTLHSDLSAKFEGGVGINGVTAGTDAVLRIRNENDSTHWPLVVENDNGNVSFLVSQSSGGDGRLYLRRNGDASGHVRLDANATSYFNGGNLAIGQTSASNALDVQGGTTNTAIVARSSDAKAQVSLVDSGTTGVGSVVIGAESDDLFLTAGSGGTEAFRIKSNGTQDHKSNSIVNSATVAGLQDGACYDFDGSSSYITFDSFAGALATDDAFTISVWFKSPSGLTAATSGEMLVSAHTSGSQNRLRLGLDANSSNEGGLFYSDNVSGDTSLGSGKYQDDKWHNVVVARPSGSGGQTAKFYVDGIEVDTLSIGPTFNDVAKWSIGQEYDGSLSVTDHFTGQIRDVKIFPSALTAADIRKLYSGENPKKNLNVELIANGDFSDSIGSEWAGSTDATLTQNNGQLTVTSSGSNYGAAYAPISITEGKHYLLTFDMVDTDANSYIRVGTIDATNKTGPSQVSSNILSNAVVADGTTVRTFFVASSSQASDGYLAFGGRNDMTTLVLDNVSLTEVGTLVDFTPQSASSSKWRNEALLGLYDGTVNNATLSQGNSYWNNIRQEGDKVLLLPKADSPSSSSITTARLGIGIDDPAVVSAPITLRAEQNTPFLEVKDDSAADKSRVSFEYNYSGTDRLDINIHHPSKSTVMSLYEGDDVKVHGKLGVGGAAATRLLELHNTTHPALRISNGNNEADIGIASSAGALMTSAADDDLVIVRNGEYGISIGTNGTKRFGITSAGVATFTENVAIGGTSSLTRLTVRGDCVVPANANGGVANTQLLDTRAYNTAGGVGAGLHLGGVYNSSDGETVFAELRGIKAYSTNGNYAGELAIKTRIHGGNLTERLRIKDDGTQDHNGNRIVNCQTVNDSWRSSEPSLRFDGSDDYVSLPTSSYDAVKGSQITVSAWIKRATDTNVYDGIVAAGVNLADGFALLIGGGTNADITDKLFWQFDGTAGQIDGESGGVTIPLGEWTHVVGTYDGTTLKTYVNGVADRTSTSAGKSLDGSNKTIYIGAQGANSGVFSGEIKDVRIQNRALDADEIKGLYNGEATPYKYADADPSFFYNESGSYTYWSGGGNHSASVSSNILTATASGASNGSSNAVTISASNVGTFVTGKTYKWQFQAKLGSGTTSATLRARTPFDHSDVTDGSYKDFVLTSDWVTYEITGTQIAVENAYFGIIAANAYNANVDIRNIKASEAGEVAAYTPQSIGETRDNGTSGNGKKWYDTTTNNNDGTITGATKVGRTHFGRLDIGTGGGSSAYDLDVGETGKGKLNRIDFYDSNRYIERDSNDLTFYSHYSGFKFNAGSVSGGTRTGGVSLQVNGDRSVKATSADSDNLFQVGRGIKASITVGTTNAANGSTKTIWNIYHQLGTANVVVSVREGNASVGSRTHVETLFHGGEYLDGNGSWQANVNYAAIEFASAPADNTVFDVTVIGI